MTRCAPDQREVEKGMLRMTGMLLKSPGELPMVISHDGDYKRNSW